MILISSPVVAVTFAETGVTPAKARIITITSRMHQHAPNVLPYEPPPKSLEEDGT